MLHLVALCRTIARVFPNCVSSFVWGALTPTFPIPVHFGVHIASLLRPTLPSPIPPTFWISVDVARIINHWRRRKAQPLASLLSSHMHLFLTCSTVRPFRHTIICFPGVLSGSTFALCCCRRMRSLCRYAIRLVHPFLSLVISHFRPLFISYRPRSGSCALACTFRPFQGLSHPLSATQFSYALSTGLTIHFCHGADTRISTVYRWCGFPSDFATLYLFRWHIELLALKLRLVVRCLIAWSNARRPSLRCFRLSSFVFAVNVRVK